MNGLVCSSSVTGTGSIRAQALAVPEKLRSASFPLTVLPPPHSPVKETVNSKRQMKEI